MGDPTKATWTRTLKRLRRAALELKAYGWEIREPDNAEGRVLQPDWTSAIVEVSRTGVGAVPAPDRPGVTGAENV